MKKNDIVTTAQKIRAVRSDITPADALSIARLPTERVGHLRRHGLLNRGEVAGTVRKLRLLGEIKTAPAVVSASVSSESDLLERFLPIVQNLVDRAALVWAGPVNVESARAVGLAALRVAVQKFDPEQSATFPSYATACVRTAIFDNLRRIERERIKSARRARR